MELERFYAFRVVAQTENISRAAELMHVSQPALSQTIRRLEEDWNCPLFDRDGRRIRLNRAGKILLAAVEEIDDVLDRARMTLAEEAGRPPVISLYIGCASMLLPELLHFLRSRTPEVSYQLFQWSGAAPNPGADLHIVAVPGNAGETSECLMQEPIGLALPAGHPLLQKEQIILYDLMNEEMISLNPEWELYNVTSRALEAASFTPRITTWVDNPNLLRDLLRMGMGLAFVPLVSWRAFAGEEVILRPLADCTIRREIYLVHRQGKTPPKAVSDCMEGIRIFFRHQVETADCAEFSQFFSKNYPSEK